MKDGKSRETDGANIVGYNMDEMAEIRAPGHTEVKGSEEERSGESREGA
jgi:hypothetical protein